MVINIHFLWQVYKYTQSFSLHLDKIGIDNIEAEQAPASNPLLHLKKVESDVPTYWFIVQALVAVLYFMNKTYIL